MELIRIPDHIPKTHCWRASVPLCSIIALSLSACGLLLPEAGDAPAQSLDGKSAIPADIGPTDTALAPAAEADPPTPVPPTPVPLLTPEMNWQSIAAGSQHSCSVDSRGQLTCWGDMTANVGVPTTPACSAYETQPSAAGRRWAHVCAGGRFGCGLDDTGVIWCWGRGDFGQLGQGDYLLQPAPVAVYPDWTWQHVSCGRSHVCAVRRDGSLWCWGKNDQGQVRGDSSASMFNLPQPVDLSQNWSVAVAGSSHSCALDVDGKMSCWGDNTRGNCGVGSSEPRIIVPTPIATEGPFIRASASRHTCAVHLNRSLWCWGVGDNGILGVNNIYDSPLPVQVGTAIDWQQISTGTVHTCGIRGSGELYCWGAKGARLGFTSTVDVLVPQQVGTDTDWSEVTAGLNQSSGRRLPGVYVWGRNDYCQVASTAAPHANQFTPMAILP